MNRAFSTYLDLVRFSAACLVYLWHANKRLLTTDILPASNYGHSSVIVFFVLSGLVIAFATDTKESNWIDYGSSRLSRVFSVVIPTLLLTPLLDAAGRALYPALYDYPWDQFGLRLLGSALLLNEAWFVSITFFSNVPYWSIAYEFWYYAAFGLFTFLPGRTRWIGLGAVLLLVGPKWLLLLPIWWAGVVLYRWRWPQQWSQGFSWCLVVVSTLGIVLTHAIDFYAWSASQVEPLIGKELFKQLTFSHNVPGDYLLGALVFLNFAGMRQVAPSLAPLMQRIERPVKFLASYTFTLYLLHQPLFLFWGAVLRGDPHGRQVFYSMTVLTALSVLVIGHFTERRRQPMRIWLGQTLRRVASAIPHTGRQSPTPRP